MANALYLAKYIITEKYRARTPITNPDLQQLLYACQAHWLKKYNKAYFLDDFIASDLGPLLPNVYEAFKSEGTLPLTRDYKIPLGQIPKHEIINQIIETYQLEPIPYMPKAWSVTLQEGPSGAVISKETIKKFV